MPTTLDYQVLCAQASLTGRGRGGSGPYSSSRSATTVGGSVIDAIVHRRFGATSAVTVGAREVGPRVPGRSLRSRQAPGGVSPRPCPSSPKISRRSSPVAPLELHPLREGRGGLSAPATAGRWPIVPCAPGAVQIRRVHDGGPIQSTAEVGSSQRKARVVTNVLSHSIVDSERPGALANLSFSRGFSWCNRHASRSSGS